MWVKPHKLVEDFPRVSVDDLLRVGVICRERDDMEEQWGWVPGCSGRVTATYEIAKSRLRLHVEGRSELVEVEWTKCGYGGKRPWFRCPRCETRRARLHFVADSWACRVCHDLRYRSQRLPLAERQFDRARWIRREVLGQRGWIMVLDPLPPRPKGMKLRRYLELSLQVDAYETVYLSYCAARAVDGLGWAESVRTKEEARRASFRRAA